MRRKKINCRKRKKKKENKRTLNTLETNLKLSSQILILGENKFEELHC